MNFKLICTTGLVLIFLSACKDDRAEPAPTVEVNTIPEFYKSSPEGSYGENPPEIVRIASSQERILRPTDLDFNPTRDGELWVVNEGTENTGGSTVMFENIKNPLLFDHRQDGNAWHFMSLPTGIAFGDNGFWATSPGVRDANHQNGTFTGPTLWSANLKIYARPSGGNGSHMDMLHGSPYSMGIAWERDNVYWVTDGFNGHLCKYDFKADHGAGQSNHDDGIIHRLQEVNFKRVPGIPSHLEISDDKKFLYAVDNGNKRVVKVDLTTITRDVSLQLTNEILADHARIKADYKIVSDDELEQYCGIALSGDRIFLSDYNTGVIVCLDAKTNYELGRIETGIEGITGIAIDSKNQLYFVSYKSHALYRVDPR